MESFKSFLRTSKKSVMLAVIILIVVIYSLIDTEMDRRRSRQLEGMWAIFNSQEKLTGNNDPDGFAMTYPANWQLIVNSNGGTKNLGERRVLIEESIRFFGAKTYVSVWWKRVDDSWTMYDARDWYIDHIGFGINRSTLKRSHDSFTEINIGTNGYPALERVFNLARSEKRRVIVFVVDNEAFAIDFHGQNYRETEDVFEQMLNSFEDYE